MGKNEEWAKFQRKYIYDQKKNLKPISVKIGQYVIKRHGVPGKPIK